MIRPVITLCRIFEESDTNKDGALDVSEVKEFLHDIKFQKMYSDKGKAAEDMMVEFDMDNDKKITTDEFAKGMDKWIEQTSKDTDTYRLKEVHIYHVESMNMYICSFLI